MTRADELMAMRTDGVVWMAERQMAEVGNDGFKRSEALKEIARLIEAIPDTIVRGHYKEMVRKMLKVKNADMNAAFNQVEKEARKKFTQAAQRDDDYELPREVVATGGSLESFEHDIRNYGVFEHRHVLYAVQNDRYFERISNFSIEIIQHMEDEKFPMKLVKMSNGEKHRTFDTPSKSFNSLQSFKEMVTNFGNFQFTGKQGHLDMLIAKLFNEMGDGRMITVLGYQPEGFWCFQNCVVMADGEVVDLDEYGCFDYNGASYYIPAGNSIYQYMSGKFSSEKLAKRIESKVTIAQYLHMMKQVHQERAMNAILHTIATTFSDLIYEKCGFFPILFLYGEASTGKDNLIFSCQSFYGKPQKALLLTGANTEKARVRVSAQFKNMIVNMREYINEPKIVEYLTGFWDRSGYTRGTIDSPFGTETVSIDSSAIISSNEYPVDDALLTRLVVEEFMKNTFTEDEKMKYNAFTDVIQDGISSLLADIIMMREAFETEFREQYKIKGKEIRKDLSIIGVADRMIDNITVYAATYALAARAIKMPFDYDEWLDHAKLCLTRQARKRETGSVVTKFFEIFLDLVRDKNDPIIHEREFRINGSELSFNFRQIYTRYARHHRIVFNRAGLSQSEMMDKLRKSEAFMEMRKRERIGPGVQTSSLVFDMNQLSIAPDLEEIVHWKHNERGAGSGGTWIDTKSQAAGDDDDLPY